MKKTVCILLSAAALAAVVFTSVSLRARKNSFDFIAPVCVEGYIYGDFDELRVKKIYQLDTSQNVAEIPADTFQSSGRTYHLIQLEQISAADLDCLESQEIDCGKDAVLYAAVFGSDG